MQRPGLGVARGVGCLAGGVMAGHHPQRIALDVMGLRVADAENGLTGLGPGKNKYEQQRDQEERLCLRALHGIMYQDVSNLRRPGSLPAEGRPVYPRFIDFTDVPGNLAGNSEMGQATVYVQWVQQVP